MHRRTPFGHPDAMGRAQRQVRRTWAAAWLGAAVLRVANGTAREALYARRVGERTARRLSTATLLPR